MDDVSESSAANVPPAFPAMIFAAINLEQNADVSLSDNAGITEWLLWVIVTGSDLTSTWALLTLLAKHSKAPELNPLLFEKLIAKLLHRCISLARPVKTGQNGLTISAEDQGFITKWIQTTLRRKASADKRIVWFDPVQLLKSAYAHIKESGFFHESKTDLTYPDCFGNWQPGSQNLLLGSTLSHLPKTLRESHTQFLDSTSPQFSLVTVLSTHTRSTSKNK